MAATPLTHVVRAAELAQRFVGAPESLASALAAALRDPTVPRVTRRELERALQGLIQDVPRGVGVVPFVVVSPGHADGRIYRVVATDRWRGDLTPVPPALAQRVTAWLLAADSALSLAGLHLHLTGPAPGVTWSGRSCEAALVLAAVSWALRVSVPDDLVVTGALGEAPRLAGVDHLDDKSGVVARDLPRARLVHGDQDLAQLMALLPGAAEARVHHQARSAASRARAAVDALTAHRHQVAEEAAEDVLASEPEDPATRARALWVRGAVRLHHGRATEGLADLDEAASCLPAWEDHLDDPPEDQIREELGAWTLVALLDVGAAQTAYRRGLALLEQLERSARASRRWRFVALQVAGSTHRAAIACGALDEAAALLTDWGLGRSALADQRARCLGDLAEVHRRRGEPVVARDVLAQARASLPHAGAGAPATALFLDLFEARLDADTGQPVTPPREAPSWPGLGFQVLATRKAPRTLAALHALPAVRASLPLQWVVASEAAWQAARGIADPTVLEAVRTDLARWVVDEPGLVDLLRHLVQGPTPPDWLALRRRAPYG